MTDFEVWSALPGHRDYAVSNLITHVCRGWKWRGLPTQERAA
jgi:hypothetical protein